MIFKPELCQAILEGKKTQTRRLIRKEQRLCNWQLGGRAAPGVEEECANGWRVKWQVGRTYAIQPGRSKKAIGRFLLLSIRRERLQEISEEDAEAEGCRVSARHFIWGRTARLKFARLWDSINTKKGTRWIDNPEAWCLTFELVPDSLHRENGLT